jgi:hypothetical protein
MIYAKLLHIIAAGRFVHARGCRVSVDCDVEMKRAFRLLTFNTSVCGRCFGHAGCRNKL